MIAIGIGLISLIMAGLTGVRIWNKIDDDLELIALGIFLIVAAVCFK